MFSAEFEVEAITPIFMCGADQTQAEIRASSIKGLMRWWFRALAGNYFGDDVVSLRRIEEYVFGSTGQRSRVVVEVESDNLIYIKEPLPMVWRKDKKTKMMGRLRGSAINGTFKVYVKSHNINSLELAFYSLYILFTLGSIGFRHTRGAGSVKINKISFENFELTIDVPYNFEDKNNFCQKINKTIGDILDRTNEIIDILVDRFKLKVNRIFNSCCKYSALTSNCSSVYIWSKNNVKDIYYKSNNFNNPQSLLDNFESVLKSYTNINCGFENYIFGLPRANKKRYRRMSPMHVGVVKTNKEYFLKIVVFKTDPYHPM